MESVLKVGRTMGGGVYRAAGLLARGARRILSAIPLLGISSGDEGDDTTVRRTNAHGVNCFFFESLFFFWLFAV